MFKRHGIWKRVQIRGLYVVIFWSLKDILVLVRWNVKEICDCKPSHAVSICRQPLRGKIEELYRDVKTTTKDGVILTLYENIAFYYYNLIFLKCSTYIKISAARLRMLSQNLNNN